MRQQKKAHPEIKIKLHPRNQHRNRYDFDKLTQICPDLKAFVVRNSFGDQSIDFSDPTAVTLLNKSLLKNYYGIDYWEIPENYLCPAVPGRADYVHYVADLLEFK